MDKYTVIVTRNTTESTVTVVEAADRHAAKAQALSQSRQPDVSWEQDDTPNLSKDHYVTGTAIIPPADA